MRIRPLTGATIAGLVALTGVAAAQPIPKQSFPYKSGPVTITSCTLNENKNNSTVTNNSLRINYFDNAKQPLTSITFRVRYAGTPVTVTDTGSFDPQKPITHQFDQLGGHAWAGASPSVCRVVTATFADKTVVNPPYDGPDGTSGDAAAPALPPAGAMAAPPPPTGADAPAPAPPAAPAAPAAPAPAGT